MKLKPNREAESYTAAELQAITKELISLHAESEQRIPYAKLQEMVQELGMDPGLLDQAIRNTELEQAANGRRRDGILGLCTWVAVAAVIVILCDGWKIRTNGIERALGLRKASASVAPPLNELDPDNLDKLRSDARLFTEPHQFRLDVHNPSHRRISRILVRISGTETSRVFDHEYWFSSSYGGYPLSSFSLNASHKFPEFDVYLTAWKIKKVELFTD